MIIFDYSRSIHLENYARVVVFERDLQKASFRNVTDFLFHGITAQLLALYTHTNVLFKHQNLAAMIESHSQFCICYDAQVHAGWSRQSILLIKAIADLG